MNAHKENVMDESDFEGTLILEKLATIGKVDDFFAAVDSDDVTLAVRLMKQANVGQTEIALVVKMLEDA